MNADVRLAVRQVVQEVLELDPDELRDDGNFFHEYGCTSLRFMGLMLGLERRFALRYPVAETENLASVDDVVRLTERYLVTKAAV